MIETLENAQDELKRVDHLIFVSLKYTRTVDVLKNTIQRMINFYELIVEALLKKAISEEVLQEMEASPVKKTEQVLELYAEDETIKENMEKYMEMRKIMRATYTKKEEYRRHLTMTAFLDGGMTKDITMDSVKADYEQQLEFLDHIKTMILGKEND